mmetsp:Transcript_98448/g.226217  ORF Transcript_98448/g.226217 Transcript_98448/m.226217 type:complete len:146 (-) Transcript_98448:20-457(-)
MAVARLRVSDFISETVLLFVFVAVMLGVRLLATAQASPGLAVLSSTVSAGVELASTAVTVWRGARRVRAASHEHGHARRRRKQFRVAMMSLLVMQAVEYQVTTTAFGASMLLGHLDTLPGFRGDLSTQECSASSRRSLRSSLLTV